LPEAGDSATAGKKCPRWRNMVLLQMKRHLISGSFRFKAEVR